MMKNTLSALSLVSMVLASSPALAIHAYHDENCTILGTDIQLTSRTFLAGFTSFPKDDQVVGGYIGKSGAEIGLDGNETVLLKVVGESKRTKKKYDDGCWTGVTGKFSRKVVVKRITEKTAGEMNLTRGERVTLTCEYEDIAPTLPGCNDL